MRQKTEILTTTKRPPKSVIYMPFTGAMVCAMMREIDPKTETRRTMKTLPMGQRYDGVDEDDAQLHWFEEVIGKDGYTENYDSVVCPYGQPGTQLWVKESAWVWCHKKADGFTGTGRAKWRYIPVGQHVVYSAGHPKRPTTRIDDDPEHEWRLKVGRFLPGWGIRTKLEVVSLHAERLQDISEVDAKAEGAKKMAMVGSCDSIFPHPPFPQVDDRGTYKFGYQILWESINGAGSWDLNPWVWVIKFKRIPQSI
jgi:hypothetical protein